MSRPPKYRLKDGRPIRRIGERRLTALDETGKVHPIATMDEATSILCASRELLGQLVSAGVVRIVAAESGMGTRLYSRLDLEACARQLYGDGASAEVATGLKQPEPATVAGK